MALLSISETTTFRWSFDEDVSNYVAAGIPALGVWRQKLSDCGLARARELLDRHGLKVSHLSWAGGFTGSDGRTHRESIADAAEAVRTAAALDCPTLVVYTGPRAGHTYKHSRRLAQIALTELAPQAEELGVTLAIEPMHAGCADEWTFLTSLEDATCFLQELDRPQVKLVFDTYHLGHAGAAAEQLAAIAPRVALVQLGDARRPPSGEQNRCRIGEGVLPMAAMIAALKSGGYDGYYDMELLGEEVGPADYASLLQHAKEAYEGLVA